MNRKTVVQAGLNGLGRFGLNLLRWWFVDQEARYDISYINDPGLSLERIAGILQTDVIVRDFQDCRLQLEGDTLQIASKTREASVILSKFPFFEIPWAGAVDIVLECTGAPKKGSDCLPFIHDHTKAVLLSANIPNVDATLLYGFNHEEYDPAHHRVISFGSCTSHPGILLTAAIVEKFDVRDCLVNIIHSVPQRHVDSKVFQTLERKFCTLETVGPMLLPFMRPNRFKVNYTFVPWGGASIMDFSFRFKPRGRKPVNKDEVLDHFRSSIQGKLHGLFELVPEDIGPEPFLRSSMSGSIIESGIDVRGDMLHFFIYTNNEGSSVQMHRLASYIADRLE